MSAYRTSEKCEYCVILQEEIDNLKKEEVTTEVAFFKFQKNDRTTCPYCTKLITFEHDSGTYLNFCKNKREVEIVERWFRKPMKKIHNEKCPPFPHFHKRCFVCNGTWVEATSIGPVDGPPDVKK
jgi:hypothetical protein